MNSMEYINKYCIQWILYIYTMGLGWEIHGHYRGIDSLGRVIIICLDFLGWNADFQGFMLIVKGSTGATVSGRSEWFYSHCGYTVAGPCISKIAPWPLMSVLPGMAINRRSHPSEMYKHQSKSS